MANPKADLSACGQLVRENDPDRFFCTLFAPSDKREALFALYAFNHELARVAESVSEPMLGEIRLQWWREALDGIEAGAPRRHDVVDALAAAWDSGLDRSLLDAMIDGRSADLSPDPPQTIETLTAYAHQIASCLTQQACMILGADKEAVAGTCRDAGTAIAFGGLLRSTLSLCAQGRVLLPADQLALHSLEARDVLNGENSPRLVGVVKTMTNHASTAGKSARSASRRLPKAVVPALLPLSFALRDLSTLKANGYDAFDPGFARRRSDRQLGVLWRAFLGRV
jgi:NADH dehydrogenase [ubiquinone] 1 alpha subcomplex assembly factor 6